MADTETATVADTTTADTGNAGQSADTTTATDQTAQTDTTTQQTDAGKPLLETGGTETGEEPKSKWGDDWRTDLAKGDEKLLKRLERFASPSDVAKSLDEAERKIKSGEYKKSGPAPTDPEQLKSWRAENGIPESPDKYELKLEEGLVIGDDMKPVLNPILAAAHAANAPPSVVNAMVNAYMAQEFEAEAARAESDKQFRLDAQHELMQEYGGEFRMNMGIAANGAKSQYGEELAGLMMNARLPDGTSLGDHPDFIRGQVKNQYELNPVSTVMPSNSQDPGKALATEMEQIKAKMGTPEYTEKDRARYMELIEASSRQRR